MSAHEAIVAALVGVRRNAEGHAVTARARGHESERDWLDLLHLLDIAERDIAPIIEAEKAAALREAADLAEAIDDLGRTPFDDMPDGDFNRFASHPLVKDFTRRGIAKWLRDRADAISTPTTEGDESTLDSALDAIREAVATDLETYTTTEGNES